MEDDEDQNQKNLMGNSNSNFPPMAGYEFSEIDRLMDDYSFKIHETLKNPEALAKNLNDEFYELQILEFLQSSPMTFSLVWI